MLGLHAPDPRVVRAEHIRMRLRMAGWATTDLSRTLGLQKNALDVALNMPHKEGERIIAQLLNEPAWALWPERYDLQTGERLTPQPMANYDGLPSFAQRRETATLGSAAA